MDRYPSKHNYIYPYQNVVHVNTPYPINPNTG
jgi:hypothetical protein